MSSKYYTLETLPTLEQLNAIRSNNLREAFRTTSLENLYLVATQRGKKIEVAGNRVIYYYYWDNNCLSYSEEVKTYSPGESRLIHEARLIVSQNPEQENQKYIVDVYWTFTREGGRFVWKDEIAQKEENFFIPGDWDYQIETEAKLISNSLALAQQKLELDKRIELARKLDLYE